MIEKRTSTSDLNWDIVTRRYDSGEKFIMAVPIGEKPDWSKVKGMPSD